MRQAQRADLLIALVLAGWGLATSEGSPLVAVAVLLMTLPLGWRRAAPTLVAVPVATGFALQAVPADPPESLATLVAAMVAAYSVTAHAVPRSALAGIALLLAGGVAEAALASDGDYMFIVVVLSVAASAGYAMSMRSQQAELDRQRDAAAAVAEERERIARELHDSVAHAVSLMVVQAGVAETALARDDDAAPALERIRATGHDAVADLGRMVGLLRNGAGDPEPVHGISQPKQLVDSFRGAGLDVTLTVTGEPRAMPAGLDSAAYRIAQEALTNALKHGSGAASVTVAYEPTVLGLRVENPIGGAGPGPGTGHGLVGIRERAHLYGGEAAAVVSGGKFTVDVQIPLAP